ncbi:hypothetical protein [Quadrisphaera granulorum]|uniref:hypothetical protein n=1 Tax=Quadrisphaera granulorum TaxID=317664 RepID=UPI000D6D7675|nr:hypothetical protein [Quadrisphaera granulorum]
MSQRTVDRYLAAGLLCEPVTGVYCDARTVDDDAVRIQILALAMPEGAAATRGTAAWIHGFDPRAPHERGGPLQLECVVDPSSGLLLPRRRGLITHHDRLPAGDVIAVGGIPVTSVDRTALDVARFLAPHMGLAVVDAMAHAGLIDPASLRQRYEEWPERQRWMGRGKRTLELCEPKSESFGESWTRLRVIDAGFPRPEPQIWVPEERPGAFRLDMGWREVRRAIEFDGEEDHSKDDDRDRDDDRRERLRRDYGWTVWPVRKGDVLGWDMNLERAVGELLGLEPKIRRRMW